MVEQPLSRTTAAKLVRRKTMRLSDAGLRRPPTKLLYLKHRSSPWLTEDASPRVRSNRLLVADLRFTLCIPRADVRAR
jgi:hypothetical protein